MKFAFIVTLVLLLFLSLFISSKHKLKKRLKNNMVISLQKTKIFPYQISKQNFVSYVTSKTFLIDEFFLIKLHLNNKSHSLIFDTGSHLSWIKTQDENANDEKIKEFDYSIGKIKGAETANNQQNSIYGFHFLSNVESNNENLNLINGIIAMAPRRKVSRFSFIDTLIKNGIIQNKIFQIEKSQTKKDLFYLKFLTQPNADFMYFKINEESKFLFWNFHVEHFMIEGENTAYKKNDINSPEADFEFIVDSGSAHISAPYALCERFKFTLVANNSSCEMFNYKNRSICGFGCKNINEMKHFNILFKQGDNSFNLNTERMFKYYPYLETFFFEIIFG